MTTYILVIWTVVAMGAGRYHVTPDRVSDWRPVGEFKTAEACERAGEHLTEKRTFRCLPTK